MFLSSFNPIKIYTLYENSVKTTNMLLIAGFLVYEKKFSKEEKNNKSKSCSIHLNENIEKVRLKMYIKPWNDAIIDVSEHVLDFNSYIFYTTIFNNPPYKRNQQQQGHTVRSVFRVFDGWKEGWSAIWIFIYGMDFFILVYFFSYQLL